MIYNIMMYLVWSGCCSENKAFGETAPVEVRNVKNGWSGLGLSESDDGWWGNKNAEQRKHVHCDYHNSQSEVKVSDIVLYIWHLYIISVSVVISTNKRTCEFVWL